MKAVIVKMSLKALRDLLHLPDDVLLTKVRQEWEDEKEGVFEVLVEAPTLPEVAEYQPYPRGYIEINADPGCDCSLLHITGSTVKVY